MWTHQAIECLLNEVRKRKSIYDQRHVDYLNRNKRQSHMESICKILLEKEELNVSVNDVKAKIQVLRSQLNKELRYMARSKKYKPKLWCFKKMEFLKPYCGMRTNTPYIPPITPITNGQAKRKTPKNSVDQNESISSNVLEAEAPSSSNVFASKTSDVAETTTETTKDNCYNNENFSNNNKNIGYNNINGYNNDSVYTNYNNYDNGDPNQQLYDTIAFTQQIIQNRISARMHKTEEAPKKYRHSSWEGDLVKNQLDLITDETIRSDTMWEIQCVLRRGIEQDRVLPRRRRNRRFSLAASEISPDGSCISLDSNDTVCKNTTETTAQEQDIVIE